MGKGRFESYTAKRFNRSEVGLLSNVENSGKTNKNAFNPVPNKPWFLRVCSISLLKTLWEKENPCPDKPLILRVCRTSLLKTSWEKQKLLVTSNFCFSHSVFYSFGELSAIHLKFKIVVCKFLPLWKSLKFVVWEINAKVTQPNAEAK